MPHAFHPPAQMAELLGDESLSLEELARACRRAPEWVQERVSTGVLASAQNPAGTAVSWRFASATLVRARRVSELEACFDADPHLAALTVDLMEEVHDLRQRLQQLQQLPQQSAT